MTTARPHSYLLFAEVVEIIFLYEVMFLFMCCLWSVIYIVCAVLNIVYLPAAHVCTVDSF